MLKIHQYSSTCCPTFLQAGLAEAVDLPEAEAAVTDMLREFSERRKLLPEKLDEIPQI